MGPSPETSEKQFDLRAAVQDLIASGTVDLSSRNAVMGRFEEAIVLAALCCGANATAKEIKAIIDQRMGERAETSVYTTIERLAGKGMLAADKEAQTSGRKGGRKRLFYRVTPEGRDSVVRSVACTNILAREAGLLDLVA